MNPTRPPVPARKLAVNRPALKIVAAYLAITLPLLVAGAAAPAAGALVVHLALLALVLGLLVAPPRRAGPLGVIADWLPLLLMAALYAELPYIIAAGGRPLQDPVVLGWERWMFGGDPARQLAIDLPNPFVANLLHLAYLLYYPLIFVPPGILYLRRRRLEFAHTIVALASVFAVCFIAFVAFPVEGPRYLWPPSPAPPNEPVRALALRILAAGSSRGAAFPSSHMAVSVVQTACALRFQPLVGIVVAVVTVGIGLGAVYGGFHYAVDMVAGAAVGVVVWGLVELATARAAAHAVELSASRATNAS